MEKMRERMIFDFSPPGREVVLVGGERIWHLAARLKHRKKKQSQRQDNYNDVSMCR